MKAHGNNRKRPYRQMQRTPLTRSHVAALRAAGLFKTYPAGAFLAHPEKSG